MKRISPRRIAGWEWPYPPALPARDDFTDNLIQSYCNLKSIVRRNRVRSGTRRPHVFKIVGICGRVALIFDFEFWIDRRDHSFAPDRGCSSAGRCRY